MVDHCLGADLPAQPGDVGVADDQHSLLVHCCALLTKIVSYFRLPLADLCTDALKLVMVGLRLDSKALQVAKDAVFPRDAPGPLSLRCVKDQESVLVV